MLNIEIIPAFTDNYIFLITCKDTNITAVIDPGDADAVIHALAGRHLDIILLTHHHHDHIGGVQQLKENYDSIIVGHEKDAYRLPPLDISVNEGDQIHIGHSTAHVLETNGHTIGHIVYHFPSEETLFCGDTLFSSGCGRLFEGSAEDLFNSFVKLKEIDPKTKVYCAHEYTESNLTFLLNVFPDNTKIRKYMKSVQRLRQSGEPTIPTTIEQELKTNPFFTAKTAQELAHLRKLKDAF